MRRRSLGGAAALLLVLSLVAAPRARANGDPASHVLLAQRLFAPLTAPLDTAVAEQLNDLLEAADESGFPIRVALIATPGDLGTAFALYEKPQQYAEFLGKEITFVYSDRLLVVMPNGYGFAVNGEPESRAARTLTGLQVPGRDATRQARAAARAVRRLATAAGYSIEVSTADSTTRDRILIAGAALLGLAVIGALVVYHRKSRTL